ncbi:MAG: hypothetical protein AAGB18_02560 [Pseudomonadota bacterium]
MRYWILAAILAVSAGQAQANIIWQACLSSDRNVNPSLCSCIQAAADRTLSARDQRVAASFFSDPDRSEEMRMSKRRTHEAFWDRYKEFGAVAASVCS